MNAAVGVATHRVAGIMQSSTRYSRFIMRLWLLAIYLSKSAGVKEVYGGDFDGCLGVV